MPFEDQVEVVGRLPKYLIAVIEFGFVAILAG